MTAVAEMYTGLNNTYYSRLPKSLFSSSSSLQIVSRLSAYKPFLRRRNNPHSLARNWSVVYDFVVFRAFLGGFGLRAAHRHDGA